MKLHRLVLTNYRGISHREIVFPDRGVVVVCGANEIGKSSMIEALDLLLEAKDRSSKREVKEVKPTHADVGAEVTAEISTGPYRFEYRKRFHKKCETQLTVLSPRREQLTGDEAHDRVLAMLAETVDTNLWQAQRILQSSSTAMVDLSGCDALSRALDVAAGEADTLSGAEPLLVDRVEAEYLRYFTRTGKPTGEWAAVTARLRAADDDVARASAAVAEVDEAVRRHAELTRRLEGMADERAEASKRVTAARAAADVVAELTRQLKEGELVVAATEAAHTASAKEVADRRRLRADIEERVAAIADLESTAAAAEDERAIAAEVHEAAEAAADGARAVAEAGRLRVEGARTHVERLADRDEADRLAALLDKVEVSVREIGRIDQALAGIALTDELMRTLEDAARAVDLAAGQVELVSAHIELTAAAGVEIVIGGKRVTLNTGATVTSTASAPTEIEVPGVLTARITPGTSASRMQAKLEAAQESLSSALAVAGVDDIADARVLDGQRGELAAARDRFRARLDALTADDDIDTLRVCYAEVKDRVSDHEVDHADLGVAKAELAVAVAAHHKAAADCETHRKAAELAAKCLGDKQTRVTILVEKRFGAQAEVALSSERLAGQRAVATDDDLGDRAAAAEEQLRRAVALAAELRDELARSFPDAVTATLQDEVRRAEVLAARHDETVEGLREVSAQLKVYGTEGRKGQLDVAGTERAHAEVEFLRVQHLARAAQLLRSVIARHRDETRLRYVEPFTSELERLGRLVFGDGFEVEVDSELRICSRTLMGRTVPYDSLSGGAKEQLGIVARLASAALVAKEDSVPVVIDDALGFTDADRLVKMGAVFNAVGGDGQVIVLTCSPHRYAAVDGAHHIELTA